MSQRTPAHEEPPLPVLIGNNKPIREPLIEGPCTFYYRLSYRRRFLRDLKLVPPVLLVLLPAICFSPRPAQILFAICLAVCVLASAISLSYNYLHWQKEKRAAAQNQ